VVTFYWILAAVNLLNSLWMIAAPYHWYVTIPAAVPDTGDFNPHFVRDIGVTFAVIGVGFAWCARNLQRAYPVHVGATAWYVGHAATHVWDILAGRLPHTHWTIDAPAVFVPAVLLVIIAMPPVWRRVVGSDGRLGTAWT
jgi:hypothetical protein